jgi:hypothetical protein
VVSGAVDMRRDRARQEIRRRPAVGRCTIVLRHDVSFHSAYLTIIAARRTLSTKQSNASAGWTIQHHEEGISAKHTSLDDRKTWCPR